MVTIIASGVQCNTQVIMHQICYTGKKSSTLSIIVKGVNHLSERFCLVFKN